MTGGLPSVLMETGETDIYCHPNIFHKKYKLQDQQKVEIGVPWEKSEVEELGAKFLLKSQPKEILPDIWISGEVPRLTEYEKIDEEYLEHVLESYIHDEIHDDMALIIKTTKGLIILMGCGHSGPVNTAKHAMRIAGENHIHLIMGGMHLQAATDEKVLQIANHLIELKPDFIAPLHCCGFRCINYLFNHLRNRIRLMNVGDQFILN
jgi:7,8-dihydropterin-6-yl-methyl-4-(beta-D-ribofuranosyl)aminobenzene 5'-phosphate synthase